MDWARGWCWLDRYELEGLASEVLGHLITDRRSSALGVGDRSDRKAIADNLASPESGSGAPSQRLPIPEEAINERVTHPSRQF